MNYGIVSQEQLEQIDGILSDKLIKLGVDCVIIIDMAGNIITAKDNGQSKYDVYSFAALAAGNFATVDAMAKLVGEQEFSLLFHKGTDCNIHFSKVDDELLKMERKAELDIRKQETKNCLALEAQKETQKSEARTNSLNQMIRP